MNQEGIPLEGSSSFQSDSDRLIEQLSLVDTELKKITDTVSLLSGYSPDRKQVKLVLKKGRNESPLLLNAENRENRFYNSFRDHLNIAVPNYVGQIEGYEVFDFVEGEQANPSLEQSAGIIRNIQGTEIDPSLKLAFEGEYADPDRVIDFSQRTLSRLSQIDFRADFKQAVERLIDLLPEVLEALNNRPQFLTHGDFWRGNLIASRNGITVLDWEKAQINNDHYDMATYHYTEAFMQSKTAVQPEHERMPELGFEQQFLEYNFMVQSLSQLIPVIIHKNGIGLKDWQIDWLKHLEQVIDKYSVN